MARQWLDPATGGHTPILKIRHTLVERRHVDMSHRQLKKEALALLRAEDWRRALKTLCSFPPRQIVNPLFGLLYHQEDIIRWRAVTAMGEVVARLADQNIESARIIMRRFMWNLNDESGGIGWGSPESMGEIMARHAQLADEFGCILVSYADPAGNYLEHPVLQRGVLWAWGRLGRARPAMLRPAAGLLVPYLNADDTILQGLAAWVCAPLQAKFLNIHLEQLRSRKEVITIYQDHALTDFSIGQLAGEGLAAIRPIPE